MSEYGTEPAIEVPDDAPEADVLEQYQASGGEGSAGDDAGELPTEADPADVDAQRRSAGDHDDDEYR